MRRLSQLLILLVCLLAPKLARAWSTLTTLNPETYTSPSGLYTCYVDPTDIYGRGAGNYLIKKNGRKVWSGKQPFTLYSAQVTDDGVVGGYAYSLGLDGISEGSKNGDGELFIVIMQPDGRIVLKESVPREFSRILHGVPQPHGSIVVASLERDTLQVLLHYDDRREWRAYRLSTGKRLKNVESFSEPSHSLSPLILKPIRGTPLILAHYWQYQNGDVGARFSLLDEDAPAVWSLDLPKDYVLPKNEQLEEDIRRKVSNFGAILDVSKSNQFSIYKAATAEKITFEIKSNPTNKLKWDVKEIARSSYPNFIAELKASNTFPEKELKQRDIIVLSQKQNAKPSHIRDIRSFDVDPSGHFGFIRQEDREHSSFIMIDAQGKLLHEIKMPFPQNPDQSNPFQVIWLEKDRWLITASPYKIEGTSSAWWFDMYSNHFTPIPGFISPLIKKMASSRDGGFVAIARTQYKYTSTSELIAFDHEGKIRWRKEESYGKEMGAFLSPEDITVTTNREIALLDGIRDAIQFYDLDGNPKKAWKLLSILGHKANLPSLITAGESGGILVYDYRGNPSLLLINDTGKLSAISQLKYADGRSISSIWDIKVTTNGQLWINDGKCLAELDEKGTVNRILGKPPSTDELGTPSIAAVDQTGRTYLADDRTGAIYVYDLTGEYLHTCQPSSADFQGKPTSPILSINPKGDIYFQPDLLRKAVIHFTKNGDRLGLITPHADDIAQIYYSLPHNNQSLILGYQKAVILDASLKPIKTITRRPDNLWLQNIGEASVAYNGSFVINTGLGYGKSVWHIHFYDRNGRPKKTMEMPKEVFSRSFVYTGKYVAAMSTTHVHLWDNKGTPVLKFPLPKETKDIYDLTLCASIKDSELWLVNKTTRSVHRYVLP